MTELDLQALGIWWIPLAPPAERCGATVNAWAIEDGDLGITLVGCGTGSSDALAALSNGLAEAGATLRDVGRVVVPGAHEEHAGGLRWIVENAGRPVEVLAAGPVRARLPALLSRTRVLRAGDRIEFRRITARAMVCGGHVPPLTCLFEERHGILFSSNHLVDDPGTYARHGSGSSPEIDRDAYRVSLARLSELPVSVVLPGRGPPFAGHRRSIRKALASLTSRGQSESSGDTRVRANRPSSSAPPVPSEGRLFGSRSFARPVPQSPRSCSPSPRQGDAG